MDPIRVALVLGTRPEAIKLAPVIRCLKGRPAEFQTIVVVTAQHRQMLDQVLSCFRIVPDFDLDLMEPNQGLAHLTARVVTAVEAKLQDLSPDVLMVQGDTTTAFCAALAAFYKKIPVAHVEAGLRSHNRENPFPEEVNRRLASVLTSVHLAPTPLARQHLLKEGIPEDEIAVTGNTVVDALHQLLDVPFSFDRTALAGIPWNDHRVVLVTSHRRESWGHELENICLALKDLVAAFPDLYVLYPVHLNPNVGATVHRMLGRVERVQLTEPLNYVTFINAIRQSTLILTDSGGVQEEAPTFRKPLVVLRPVTERPEAFQAGMARVAGTSRERIFSEAARILSRPDLYRAMTQGENPYGDGRAADRIARALGRWARHERPLLLERDEFTPAHSRLASEALTTTP